MANEVPHRFCDRQQQRLGRPPVTPVLPAYCAVPVAIGRLPRRRAMPARSADQNFITPKQLVDWRQLVRVHRWIERLASMIADERAEPLA